MESSPRDNLTKRSLDVTEVLSDEETVEKKPRLEIEDVDVDENKYENVVGIEIISGDNDERVQEDSPTEVIYELSPDNEESLSSAHDVKSPSKEQSPNRSEENEDESDKNEERRNRQESEGEESEKEESEKNDKKREGYSDESDDSDDESDNNEKGESDTSDDKSSKSIVENLSEDDSDEDEIEKKQDSKRIAGKSPIFMSEESSSEVKLPSTVEIDGNEEDEGNSTDASKDEDDERMSKKERNKEDEKLFGKSDDYSKKSVEDLEGLQEDIHKELAQITGKSLQRRKHKKASSTSHREKRHKEKSSSRHKEKEKSSESRENSRKDYEQRRTKHYEYETEDKWSYDPRWSNSKQGDRRDRGEKQSWSQTYSERSPNRVVTKSTRQEDMETRVAKAEQISYGTEPSESIKETSKDSQKGVISYSMREMIRASIKERKSERPKDLRGFSREVIDSESDDSGEHVVECKQSLGEVHVAMDEESYQDTELPKFMDGESSPELHVPKLPSYLPGIQGCRSVEEFRWLNRIEEGTYGVVYRAEDKRTGEIVALKKLKMEKEKEGFPITSLREINTLLKAQHPNIVTVQEIVVGNNMDKIYIVMDFVEHDLKALMETMTQAFLGGEIKTIMIQLLRAVNHLHDNWILHRDIKTSNLLLSNKGILKVGDFGLAREYGSPLKPYTPIVVTLWYRAPELLLGAKEYSTPIDLWSVGCVFAELLTMKPLFNGQSEIGQINKIFKELGTPSDKIWPGPPAYSEFPATKKMTFAEYPYNNLRNRFGATLTDNGFDLLNSFLTYDPNRRITAEDALKHEYFKESPSPVDPSMFPSWPARSEGAKRTKKASPKAPEGGNFYKSLSGDGDAAGFHIPVGKSKGASAVPGFTLKF